MRLLTEYIFKPILKFAVSIVKGLIMWIIKQIISFFRFAWPHLLWALLAGFGLAFKLVFIGALASFRGTATVDAMVNGWMKNAILNGFPFLWERQLRFLFYVLAFVAVFAGWGIILFTAGATAWFGGDYVIELFTTP